MLDELLEDGKRHGADVPTDLGGLHHMPRMAHAGHQHLRLELVVPVDGHDVLDEPMPCSLMSSSRPMKGLTHQAPALAARRAWLGEKHSVTLTLIPSVASVLQAFKPSGISGTLTTMFLWILARSLPSLIIASASTLTTSALIGPSTMVQISRRDR